MCNNFQEWFRSKNPSMSDITSVEIFLEEVEEVVGRTFHKSDTDTGEEINKLLGYKIFKRDLLKGVLDWIFAYQKELKSVPYEYTSRDNRRDWEHDKHGWSMAIRGVMKEFKSEVEEC